MLELPEPGAPPLLLDGGLATELEARGHDLSDDLWSARLLVDAPQEIVAAHLAFYRAGAVIATTASYQATFPGFRTRGIGYDDGVRLLRRSVELAKLARAQLPGPRRWVAASAGPYGAALADGSEYRGRYGRRVRELTAFHRPRLEVLAGAEPDVLALETVPDADEGAALVEAVDGLGVPACAVLHDLRKPHPCRAAAGGGVRGSRGQRRHRGGRRQLLLTGRRAARRHGRTRGDRQTRRRVPEQRRGLGRAATRMGGALAVLTRAGAAVAPGGCGDHGWVLPGRSRGHHRPVPRRDSSRLTSQGSPEGATRYGRG